MSISLFKRNLSVYFSITEGPDGLAWGKIPSSINIHVNMGTILVFPIES